VAAVLPTRDELRLLAAIAQLRWCTRLAAAIPPVHRHVESARIAVAGGSRADRNAQLRAQISARLRQGDVDAELAVLAPLFEEHAPAMVAAALLASAASRQSSRQPRRSPSRRRMGEGLCDSRKEDNASAKDLVGALIKEVGLQKGQSGNRCAGNVSLVEVAAQVADEAVRRLTGVTIRGRRIAARPIGARAYFLLLTACFSCFRRECRSNRRLDLNDAARLRVATILAARLRASKLPKPVICTFEPSSTLWR